MSVNGFQIRAARTADIASVLVLRDRVALDLLQKGHLQWSPDRITPADLIDLIDRNVLFVAGDTIGTVSVYFDSDRLWPPGHAGYVRMLMIDPALQGRGAGKSLVEWAARYVFATGRHLVRLDCPESADGLKRFYEELGFQQLDTKNDSALFELSRDGRI